MTKLEKIKQTLKNIEACEKNMRENPEKCDEQFMTGYAVEIAKFQILTDISYDQYRKALELKKLLGGK